MTRTSTFCAAIVGVCLVMILLPSRSTSAGEGATCYITPDPPGLLCTSCTNTSCGFCIAVCPYPDWETRCRIAHLTQEAKTGGWTRSPTVKWCEKRIACDKPVPCPGPCTATGFISFGGGAATDYAPDDPC